MKTPIIDAEIKAISELNLKGKTLSKYAMDMLKEYKAIKSLIENSPIVSTPEKPVWVVDETGQKRILLADFGREAIGRYLLVSCDYEESYLNGEEFDWYISEEATPYTEKVTIEVTQDEAVKVEEFLKGLRDEK